MKSNVILIGFMGSGKTTIGLKLSFKLRVSVEDTDKIIEQRNQKTISQIFADEGEEAFRKMETELLREIADRKYKKIISLGGGTPVREENRPLIKNCGRVFYLRVKPETVYERLKGDTTRPLLQCEDPLQKIRDLLAAREEAYSQCADVIIDVDELNADEIVNKIVSFV